MTSSSSQGAISHVTQKDSPSGRSLFSRLKSPLQSKTRHFADFYIQLDDPHRQYGPGDIVSGRVVLKVVKYFRIVHLVISLHGYAQVFKNPHAPGDAYRNYTNNLGTGKGGKKDVSYYGNGFVSLFDDEVTLCGEGRLDPGLYHFNFELEFPSSGLPSSIDFERGTISYMLTSTLTRHFDPFRPVTFSPTTTCDTRVYFQDSIDIASIVKPKPRIITLEPISRLKRVKTGTRKRPITITESTSSPAGSESAEPPRKNAVSELASTTESSDGPGSPAPSDVSFESRMSSGNSGTEYGIRSIRTTVDDCSRTLDGSSSGAESRTITASIDILKGGFLRGDQIPIKIHVKHTKHVRSFRGIIVTLYRQARVDMNPALPVLNSKGDKIKSEDYYPKSRTGLGGLSLSSAGSSHLFRKDLAQSFAPLFVDPRTLTAESKCSIRIPEEAFPTISNVPGAMITFRYFVEVVVDIQGRLVRLDRMFPEAGTVVAPGEGGAGNTFSNFGTFLDTDAIRREKGVVHSVFELVVGTKDSERSAKQKQTNREPGVDGQFDSSEAANGIHEDLYSNEGHPRYHYNYEEQHPHYDHYAHDSGYYGYHDDAATPAYYESHPNEPPHLHQPQPDWGHEEGLSEKERIRRAEGRLLPSQPPTDEAGPADPHPHIPAHAHHDFAPSAPYIPEDDDDGYAEAARPYPPTTHSTPGPMSPFHAGPAAPSPSSHQGAGTIGREFDPHAHSNGSTSPSTVTEGTPRPPHAGTTSPSPSPNPPPSALPRYVPPSAADAHAHALATEDKQELQRRRLLMERSAPPGMDDDEVQAGASVPSGEGTAAPSAPSAPPLDDDDDGLGASVGGAESAANGHGRKPSEDLPLYQR